MKYNTYTGDYTHSTNQYLYQRSVSTPADVWDYGKLEKALAYQTGLRVAIMQGRRMRRGKSIGTAWLYGMINRYNYSVVVL